VILGVFPISGRKLQLWTGTGVGWWCGVGQVFTHVFIVRVLGVIIGNSGESFFGAGGGRTGAKAMGLCGVIQVPEGPCSLRGQAALDGGWVVAGPKSGFWVIFSVQRRSQAADSWGWALAGRESVIRSVVSGVCGGGQDQALEPRACGPDGSGGGHEQEDAQDAEADGEALGGDHVQVVGVFDGGVLDACDVVHERKDTLGYVGEVDESPDGEIEGEQAAEKGEGILFSEGGIAHLGLCSFRVNEESLAHGGASGRRAPGWCFI